MIKLNHDDSTNRWKTSSLNVLCWRGSMTTSIKDQWWNRPLLTLRIGEDQHGLSIPWPPWNEQTRLYLRRFLKIVNKKPLINNVRKRDLRWVGHVLLRKNDHVLISKSLCTLQTRTRKATTRTTQLTSINKSPSFLPTQVLIFPQNKSPIMPAIEENGAREF